MIDKIPQPNPSIHDNPRSKPMLIAEQARYSKSKISVYRLLLPLQELQKTLVTHRHPSVQT